MNMEKSFFPVFESADNKLKNEINTKLTDLLKKGALLDDIAELLDAQEFLEHIETGKRQSAVTHFDVDGFIKKRISENRKFSLPEEYTKIDETILPPSRMEMKSGNGTGFKEMGIIPRSTMLMETLTEMGLKYSVIEGKNDSKMVRKLSYLIFAIPSMQKLVLVNDEEGNATFIIHKTQQEEWQDYIKKTKAELSEMSCDLVSSFNYPDKNKEGHEEKWKEKIKSLLINGAEQIKSAESTEAPEGWSIAYNLAVRLNGNQGTVKSFAEEYRLEHPEWFNMYKNQRGSMSEHYSPELVKIITDRYNGFKSVPDGWLNIEILMKEIGVSKKTLRNHVEVYRQEHPGWFELHEDISGKREIYFHPDLVKLIRGKFKDNTPPPNGWLSAAPIMELVKSDLRTVKKYLENHKTDHPEWFKNCRDIKGEIREYYSPELVEIIKNDYEPAPNGWVVMASLAKSLKKDHGMMKDFVRPYKISNPEWFKNYRDRGGPKREFLSPELVEMVRKNFQRD
jgi:hypothetical protein